MARLSEAGCAQLHNRTFLVDVIRQVGLVGADRNLHVYGSESVHAIKSPKAGLYQMPSQLASAMVHAAGLGVSRYIEVGIYSAWTLCIMSAYFRRLSGDEGRFKSYGVDISFALVSEGVKTMLRQLGVTLLAPGQVTKHRSEGWDLCFLDGDHSYEGVRRDYDQYHSMCRNLMLHDVVDQGLWWSEWRKMRGGVTLFWDHLLASVHSKRVREFYAQPSWVGRHRKAAPSFGIGIIGPNAEGTTAPDRPLCVVSWSVDQWRTLIGNNDTSRRAAYFALRFWHACGHGLMQLPCASQYSTTSGLLPPSS